VYLAEQEPPAPLPQLGVVFIVGYDCLFHRKELNLQSFPGNAETLMWALVLPYSGQFYISADFKYELANLLYAKSQTENSASLPRIGSDRDFEASSNAAAARGGSRKRHHRIRGDYL
jgi:hypothetical protein